MLAWHVDDRKDAGRESAHGISFAANGTFVDRWIPYARLGSSEGSAPIYNESVSYLRQTACPDSRSNMEMSQTSQFSNLFSNYLRIAWNPITLTFMLT